VIEVDPARDELIVPVPHIPVLFSAEGGRRGYGCS
jgi:hypothetical protein